ncbi:MAG: hypothetical protein GC164_08470 [Phycisphaera sp.]|nr:hypothetical protein [Phycisphaera sp.]
MARDTVKTKLLVSVRDGIEAREALEGGADIIDVKEPNHGSLGRPDPRKVGEVVRVIAGRLPVSVALGELDEGRRLDGFAFDTVHYVKVGLHGVSDGWPNHLSELYASLPGGTRGVAVAYAERDVTVPVAQVLSWAIENHCAGLLIDTHEKDGRTLLDHRTTGELCLLRESLHKYGLFLALAGSISAQAIEKVLTVSPDIVAVRGAVCERGDRTGRVRADRVFAVKAMIEAHNARAVVSAG